MDNKMSMCSVLINGSTIIYLINDEQSWIEPCVIEIHSRTTLQSKVSFMPLQVFATSRIMPPIDKAHILTSYIPEPEIEQSYRNFLDGYHKDIAITFN